MLIRTFGHYHYLLHGPKELIARSISCSKSNNARVPAGATGVDTKMCYLGAVQHGSSGHNGQGGQSQQVLALGANSDTSRTIVRKIIQSLLAFGECAATGRRQTSIRYAGRFA